MATSFSTRYQYGANYSKKGRVNKKNRCPACGRDNHCVFSDNGYWLLCMKGDKIVGTPAGWEFDKVTPSGGHQFKSLSIPRNNGGESTATAADLRRKPNVVPNEVADHAQPTTDESESVADPGTNHTVYTSLLHNLILNGSDLAELTSPTGKRRLTPDQVKSMNVKTWPSSQREQRRVLNRMLSKFGLNTLLAVPGFYINRDGYIALAATPGALLLPSIAHGVISGLRVRPNDPGDGPKYYWLSSKKHGGPGAITRAAIYMPLNGIAISNTVGISEGELKDFIAAQKLGYPFISVPGVGNWKSAGAVEQAVNLVGKGGTVVIFYDSEENRMVNLHKFNLADELVKAGLKVKVASWDMTYKGIDDLLIANGKFELSYHTLGLGGIRVDQVLNQQFLGDISLTKKVTLIRSPKGSGKTEAMKRLVSIVPANATVMAVGHRQALLAELARRLTLEYYQDFSKGAKTDRKGLTASDRLAICADSLIKLDRATNRTYVILDEVEQVLRHLTGSTIKGRRQGVVAMLEALIMRADHVIGLDADLSAISYRYFERLVGAENIEVVVNDFTLTRTTPLYQYDNHNELVAALLEAAKSGTKFYCATNNKAEAQRLERILSKELPELKVLCVHQDNSAAPDIRRVISNLNLYAPNYDCLIASPTLGTGVDLNVKHFTQTFLIGTHNSTNHTDLLQHMARNRQADSIHAYIAPGERYDRTDPAFWEKQCVEKYLNTGIAIEVSETTGERLAAQSEINYLKLWADIKAADKASHNRLAANFYEQAAREGYQVQPVHPAEDGNIDIVNNSSDPSEAVEAGIKRAAAAQELEAERKEAILTAPDISDREAEELESKAYLPKHLRSRLERHRINRFYNLPVDAALVEIDNKGRTMPRLNEFMMYVGQIDTVERDRSIFEDAENLVPDARHYTLRKDLRVEALAAAGVDLESNFTHDQLANNGFVEWGLANKDRLYSVLGLTVKSDFESRPVELLSVLFHQIGIKLQSRNLGKRNDRQRVYSIDMESAKLMWRLAKSRLEGLQKHTGGLELVA